MYEGDGKVYPPFGAQLYLYNSDGSKYMRLYNDGTNGIIDVNSGTIVQSDTENVTTIQSPTAQHLILNTTSADKNVRINSQTFTTNASIIGMQCKPRGGIALTNDVCGAEFSPGMNDTFALTGFLMGINVDPILKGTTGDLTGGVRVCNLELVADDGGNRAISSYLCQIRMRMAFSSGTVSGEIACLRIETPETQTRSKNYTCVIDFPTANGAIWADKGGSGVAFSTLGGAGDTPGYFVIKIGSNAYKVPLYS